MGRRTIVGLVAAGVVWVVLAAAPAALAGDGGRLSISGDITCGVKTDAHLECWGSNSLDPGILAANASTDTFTAVAVGTAGGGYSQICGLRTNLHIECFGTDDNYGDVNGPNSSTGTFTQISAGDEITCGVTTSAALVCWGLEEGTRISGPNSSTGTYRQVSAGAGHVCALRSDSSVQCWGIPVDPAIMPPNGGAGPYTAVTAGSGYTCSLGTNGSAVCWGPGTPATGPTTSGDSFTQIAADGLTCGVQTTGRLACWGIGQYGEVAGPNASTDLFVQVSVGSTNTCGLKVNGTLQCWGPPRDGAIDGPNASTDTFDVTCVAGTYSSTGRAPCTQADPGSFVATAGATAETLCALGMSQSNAGSTRCVLANKGSYVDQRGAVNATPCMIGSFQPLTGASSCLPALTGTYVPNIGADSVVSCPGGTYNPNAGATSVAACLTTPAGTSTIAGRPTSPIPCSPGFFQPLPGQTSCLPAGIGFFVADSGAVDETGCPVGTTTLATGSTSCVVIDFSVASDPSATVVQGGSTTVAVTTVPINVIELVGFAASGLPTGVTAGFAPASVPAGSPATLTLTALATAAPGTVTVAVTATGGSGSHTTTFQLTVKALDATPPAIAFAGNHGTYGLLDPVGITCSVSDAAPSSGISTNPCTGFSISGPAWTFGAGVHTLPSPGLVARDNAGNASLPATTSFTVTVTAGPLCQLTTQLVEGSAKYKALNPLARVITDALANALCNGLAQVVPKLTAAQKAAAVTAYRSGVQALVLPGWLTQGQADTLKGLGGVL